MPEIYCVGLTIKKFVSALVPAPAPVPLLPSVQAPTLAPAPALALALAQVLAAALDEHRCFRQFHASTHSSMLIESPTMANTPSDAHRHTWC